MPQTLIYGAGGETLAEVHSDAEIWREMALCAFGIFQELPPEPYILPSKEKWCAEMAHRYRELLMQRFPGLQITLRPKAPTLEGADRPMPDPANG